MADLYDNAKAPFVPTEEVFNEKPIRNSAEKKKGMGAFLKDAANDAGRADRLVFDEEHFNKFLKEDNTTESEHAGGQGQRANGFGYKRKRQNILGDFRFKKIDEMF